MAATIPNKNAGFGSPLWRIILTILGVVIIFYGLFNSMLGWVGTEVSASVTSVHPQGEMNTKALTGPKGTVSVDYTFQTPDGRSVSNTSTFSTDVDYNDPDNAAALNTISVRYLSFWPQMNRAAVLTGFQADTLVFPIIGLLIIVLVNWRAVRHQRRVAQREALEAGIAREREI